MQMLEEDLLQELRAPGALSTQRREAEQELEASEAQLAAAKDARGPAYHAALEAQATLKAHQKQLEVIRTESWALSEAFEEALAAAHFHDRTDFDRARRSPSEMQSLSDTLETYAATLTMATQRLAQAEQLAEGLSAPDLTALLQAERIEAQSRSPRPPKPCGGPNPSGGLRSSSEAEPTA